MSTKSILIVIAVILLGIFGVLVYEATRPKTPGEQLAESIDAVANDIGEAVEEVGDEIQDAAREK